MNRTERAWAGKKVAGALFMDVKSAFNNVSKVFLGQRMEALGIEPDLIRWTMSFMTDRQVKIALDGEVHSRALLRRRRRPPTAAAARSRWERRGP